MYITETPRVTREYYEQLYANKLDNLEETHGFLELYNLPRLNHEEMENLKRVIASTEVEAIIKKLSKNKTLRRKLRQDTR